MVDHKTFGKYVFAVSDKQVSASKADWLCNINGYKLADFDKSYNFEHASLFIKNEWPDRTDYYWRFNSDTDGKLSYAVFQPSTGVYFDDGKLKSDNFICIDEWWFKSNDKEKFQHKNPKFFPPSETTNPNDFSDEKGVGGVPPGTLFSMVETHPGLTKVNNTNLSFRSVNTTTSDVSTEEVLPTGNEFSMRDIFSKGDFSLIMLFIIFVIILFVVVVVMAIALSCVCKKYKKA